MTFEILEELRLRHGKKRYEFVQMSGFVHFLYSLVRDYENIGTIVEIGVANGVSTNSFLRGLMDRTKSPKNKKLYSIDINDCREWANVYEDSKYLWEFIQADSSTYKWIGKEIDILLIDGNHSYEAVKADYNNFVPFVRKGGLVLLHDVLWEKKGVKKFYEEDLKNKGIILPLGPSGMAVIRI